ncbi:MAG: 2'-5' RNA ligase family protein [Chloroflexi bacterium]|nr:MAG: 2'-5' RNA ligase family protein [Chloroflexota bacterium]
MGQGIVLLLDGEADATVRACWQRLDDAGIPSLTTYTHGRHVPHISLVVAERVEVGGWRGALREGWFAGPPVSVQLGPVDSFPEGGWVFLGVDGLDRSAHRRFVASLGDDVTDPWEHYLPDRWVPHCTLAGGLDPDQLDAALEVLAGSWLPIAATIDSAAVIDAECGSIRRLLPVAHG